MPFKTNKSGKETTKIYLTYCNLFDSTRCIATSLANLTEEINRIKCKFEHDNKSCETCGTKSKIGSTFLNTQTLKMV